MTRCKEPAASAGDMGSIAGWGRSPGEGTGDQFVFLPGKCHGQRSHGVAKELDVT